MIGLKISIHFLGQSDVINHFASKTCIPFSFAWFTGLPLSFVIGQSDYFDFSFYETKLKTALAMENCLFDVAITYLLNLFTMVETT